MWNEHFKNLLGNSPNVTDKPIMKIINKNLDIKQGQFTQEQLKVVQAKIKNKKLPVSIKYSQKYGRPVNSATT